MCDAQHDTLLLLLLLLLLHDCIFILSTSLLLRVLPLICHGSHHGLLLYPFLHWCSLSLLLSFPILPHSQSTKNAAAG